MRRFADEENAVGSEKEEFFFSSGDFASELVAVSRLELDINGCFGCARCSSVCKVALFHSHEEPLTPRTVVYLTLMGEAGELLRSRFIWLCSGCRRCEQSCPQGVSISEAIRALRHLALQEGIPNPVAARVNERMCIHCGACVSACPHGAICLVEGGPRGRVARVDPSECRGCGSCSAVCTNGAAQQAVLNDPEIGTSWAEDSGEDL